MVYDRAAKDAAKAYVARMRAKTFCIRCGGQPIEYHREEHVTHKLLRVAHLAALGFPIPRIRAEIDLCTPLCRRCHMSEDGRIERLTAASPNQKGAILVGLKPCIICGTPAKPLRRGLCNKCNQSERYYRLYSRRPA